MKKKKLLIFHSQAKFKVKEEFDFYVNLGDGNLEIKNSKQISLKNYYKKNYDYFRKKFINSLNKKILQSRDEMNLFNELEIFNLRNDKINDIDTIVNILILKKIVSEFKIDNIFLITDNQLTKSVLIQIYPNIEIVNFQKRNTYLLPFFKITSFYLKTFFIIIMTKFFKNYRLLKNNYNEACISLAPFFYKDQRENFFKNKNNLKLNFLLTDETHLNFSIIDIYKILKINYENLVHVESAINFKDLVCGLLRSYKYIYYINGLNMKFNVEMTDFSLFYKKHLIISAINRSKLNIYNKAVPNLIERFQIKKFNMYLFEYSFGFYLIKLIKMKFKKVDIIGYQHGIFSDKLMWFDILLRKKKNTLYFPNKIVCFNSQSLKDYKKILPNYINYKLVDKPLSKISILFQSLKKKSLKKHILILPGTHDAKIIYERFKNRALNLDKSNEIFYFKFHPKNMVVVSDYKNLKIITSINNKKFNFVLISSSSTLVYDFYKLKKKFMVYDIDNKQNLISSSFSSKIKFFEI